MSHHSISVCPLSSLSDYITFLLLNPQILTALNLLANTNSQWLNWKVNNLKFLRLQTPHLPSNFACLRRRKQIRSISSTIYPTGKKAQDNLMPVAA